MIRDLQQREAWIIFGQLNLVLMVRYALHVVFFVLFWQQSRDTTNKHHRKENMLLCMS